MGKAASARARAGRKAVAARNKERSLFYAAQRSAANAKAKAKLASQRVSKAKSSANTASRKAKAMSKRAQHKKSIAKTAAQKASAARLVKRAIDATKARSETQENRKPKS